MEEKKWTKDEYGNLVAYTLEIKDGYINDITLYKLEEGKITLRGQHKKFWECPIKERLDCNYGTCYERCQYMKYVNGNWKCTHPEKK